MMTTNLRIGLVVVSACLGGGSVVPAIVATIRGKMHPRVVTWLTWLLLTAVAGVASASVGDYPAAAFSLAGTLATGSVVIAGLRFADRSIGRIDIICLTLVLVGFVLWRIFDRPGIAVLAACLIDGIGLVPTLAHAWQRPREEAAITYALIAAGGGVAVLAAWGTWTITADAYPMYVLLSMGGCWTIIITRRHHAAHTTVDETGHNVTHAFLDGSDPDPAKADQPPREVDADETIPIRIGVASLATPTHPGKDPS